jgi:hypothetical protein
MSQTIREYHTSQQSVPEILAKDQKGFVPFISSAPGFCEYTCIDAGNGVVTSTSLFANRADGEKFNTLATTWVNENLSSLLPTQPRVTVGEVSIHATGKVLAS